MKLFGSIESKHGVDDPGYVPKEREPGRFESIITALVTGFPLYFLVKRRDDEDED